MPRSAPGTTRDTAIGRTARLHLSARFTGGLGPTQARLVTRVQPERTAVGRVGTRHAADDRIPRRACVATQGTSSSKTTTYFEETGLRSSRKADGGGVSGSPGVKDDSNRLEVSVTRFPVMAGEAPVGLRLRPQYR